MAWVVLVTSTPQPPLSTFYQPVLSRSTASKIKTFEGMPLYSYTLEIWGKIFQVLDAEAQNTPIMLPGGINISKGEGVKTEKGVVPLIGEAPE